MIPSIEVRSIMQNKSFDSYALGLATAAKVGQPFQADMVGLGSPT
jgi:hypothetical protein